MQTEMDIDLERGENVKVAVGIRKRPKINERPPAKCYHPSSTDQNLDDTRFTAPSGHVPYLPPDALELFSRQPVLPQISRLTSYIV